jgi:hypothetical protein
MSALAARARAVAVERFSNEIVVPQYLAVYAEAMGRQIVR